MRFFRAPLRLVAAPDACDPALAGALRDWGAARGDSRAIARLELRMAAALSQAARAQPVSRKPPASSYLLGLWAVHAALALVLSWHAAPRSVATVAAPESIRYTAAEIASRLGVAPRELATAEALDLLHMSPSH